MNAPQRACALLCTLWTAMHMWHGLNFREFHEIPGLNVIALLLYPGVMFFACAPLLTSRVALSDRAARTMVVVGAVITLLVLPFLSSAGLHSYAAWPAGGLGPLIAALVIRRHPWLAACLSTVVCLVITISVVRTGDVAIPWILSLSVPAALWLGGALLTERIFLSTDARVRQYARAEVLADARRTQAQTQQSHAQMRRQSLTSEVMPLLQHLASTSELTTADRERCAHLAPRIRDDLRARHLLTPDVHALLGAARDRGCLVTVVDDRHVPTDDGVAARARELMRASLPTLDSGRATYRVAPDEGIMTLVVESDEQRVDEVATALDRVGLAGDLDVDGSVLFAQVSTTPLQT